MFLVPHVWVPIFSHGSLQIIPSVLGGSLGNWAIRVSTFPSSVHGNNRPSAKGVELILATEWSITQSRKVGSTCKRTAAALTKMMPHVWESATLYMGLSAKLLNHRNQEHSYPHGALETKHPPYFQRACSRSSQVAASELT